MKRKLIHHLFRAATGLCAFAAGLVLLRDRLIRRRVGLAAWPSDGFARHVLVDDLGRLVCLTLLGLPLFLLGDLLRRLLLHP